MYIQYMWGNLTVAFRIKEYLDVLWWSKRLLLAINSSCERLNWCQRARDPQLLWVISLSEWRIHFLQTAPNNLCHSLKTLLLQLYLLLLTAFLTNTDIFLSALQINNLKHVVTQFNFNLTEILLLYLAFLFEINTINILGNV